MPAQPRPSRIHPQRALLHPLWLGALVVLVLNDHVLKGSTLIPAVVAGKLSDIAGMLVAPALLATALQVRTLRGWWLSHVAVGGVFAAIKLSAIGASAWSALMGAFGFPWAIVRDPTDLLVALPALALGAIVLRGAMATASARLARRSAEAGAAGVGLLCSVATSQPAPDGPLYPDIFADVWLHNGTDVDQVIRIRTVRPTVQLDCYAVEADPARLLTGALFGDVQSWTVPPNANIGVLDPETQYSACNIAMIDADGFAPTVLFWWPGELPARWIPGEGFDDPRGGIALTLDVDDRGHWDTDAPVVFTRGETSEPVGECAAQDDADRVDWGDAVTSGAFRVAALTAGVDGCTAIDLAADAGTRRMYLCAPAIPLPFAVGDDVNVRMEYGVQSESVVVETTATPMRRLIVSRGASAPVVGGLQIALAPLYDCALSVDDCGTVAQAASVVLGGGSFPAATATTGGDPVVLDGEDGTRITVAVAHAQQRVVIDSECAAGPQTLGDDLELALVIEDPAQ
jgi:hypothetical protein